MHLYTSGNSITNASTFLITALSLAYRVATSSPALKLITAEIFPNEDYLTSLGEMTDMLEKVIKILAEYTEADVSSITEESRLVADLGLSSLDVINVVVAFEDEFGIEK
jgi:acyl carrier protein